MNTTYILAQIEKEKDTIAWFASVLADTQSMWGEPDDFDYWVAFADYADINIYKYGSDELKCCVYPVDNGLLNTSAWIEIHLTKENNNA